VVEPSQVSAVDRNTLLEFITAPFRPALAVFRRLCPTLRPVSASRGRSIIVCFENASTSVLDCS